MPSTWARPASTGEPSILTDYAAWHSELRAATHAGYETTPIVLSALHDAVVESSPTAASYLDQAIATLD